MKLKKKGVLPSSSSLLATAFKDLEVQIKALKRDKNRLQDELKQVSMAIDVDRELERELEQKIASLMEKEAKLGEKKKKLSTDIDRVSERLGKVSKIKSEMADV
ncbi:MAG: hypothetical protein AABX53_00285 [Nanoarchaeota archaeon]